MTHSIQKWGLAFLSVLFLSPLFSEEGVPNAIIKIYAYHQYFNQRMPWITQGFNETSGSGFIIEGNLILTNAHVVSCSKYIEIKKQEDSKPYPAHIKFIEHSCDLAMLEVEDKSFYKDIVPLKLNGIPKIDSQVKTIGYPMGGEKISITTGIISRIEKILYSHTGVDEHLAIQTDSAINPGNSGCPVLQDGGVVGMAFQGIPSGENIGFMIPTTLIRHFIKDSEDQSVDGVPEIGAMFAPLPPVMKQYLKLPEGESGVVIVGSYPFSAANGILEKNDILTEINGNKISDDGTITLDGLRVQFYEIIERSQYGDTIHLVWYRMGKRHEGPLKIKKFKRAFDIGTSYADNPDYLVFAGLTFVKLNGDFMQSFGKNWWKEIPNSYRLLYYYEMLLNKDPKRECFIVLSEVLEDPFNTGAKDFKDQVLTSVNGRKILSLRDLEDAIREVKGGFYIFDFLDVKRSLVLEHDKALTVHEKILQEHNIHQSESFGWKAQ